MLGFEKKKDDGVTYLETVKSIYMELKGVREGNFLEFNNALTNSVELIQKSGLGISEVLFVAIVNAKRDSERVESNQNSTFFAEIYPGLLTLYKQELSDKDVHLDSEGNIIYDEMSEAA